MVGVTTAAARQAWLPDVGELPNGSAATSGQFDDGRGGSRILRWKARSHFSCNSGSRELWVKRVVNMGHSRDQSTIGTIQTRDG